MSDVDLQGSFAADRPHGDFLNAKKLEDGLGLCLSGGGYRAMLYHLGALVRLNELGLLSELREVASVSGGSIIAGVLGLAWPKFEFSNKKVSNFNELVTVPILNFAAVGVDVRAALFGLLPSRTPADYIAAAYDRYLFGGATLQDLASTPRFTFMATNLQTGSGWRFAKDYAADVRVGRIDKPSLPLSRVVAASSAFPPVLSPVRFPFDAGSVRPMRGADLHRAPFTEEAVLSDGGVYDNLGLERVWKRCRRLLVSNAGLAMPEIGRPSGRWVGQVFRTLNILQQQAENARKRILFGVNNLGQRKVAYWSIDTAISTYSLPDALPLSSDETTTAARMRTRLNRFTPDEIELLLRCGYAGADASLRKYEFASNSPPAAFDGLPTA
jgi:NTE family protein